jgi:transposase InsO family protein
MDTHLGHELALAALDMVIARQRPAAGLLHHSDRGVQYVAHGYRKRLRQHGIFCPMSRAAWRRGRIPVQRKARAEAGPRFRPMPRLPG